MKTLPKIIARSGRAPIVVTPEKWHSVDASITALGTEFGGLLQPLSGTERRNLLRVGIAKESFTREFLALTKAHPEIMPPMLRPAETQRDWQTREDLAARRREVATLLQQIDDTMAGLESDCLATALAGYQALLRGGAPAGLEPEVASLRRHFARHAAKAAAGATPAKSAGAAKTPEVVAGEVPPAAPKADGATNGGDAGMPLAA